MEILSEIFIVLAYIAAIGFFIFGLDDIVFDFHFILHLIRSRHDRHTTIEELRSKPEKYIAIFVPAWSEGGIVNRMADYAVKILDYERYDIFIGVYPNDPETTACVDALTKTCPRIHKALCPDPGPTSKADCLNAIYRAMRLREIPGIREYAIIALHDSEDVLHPLTLKVYNYFVPDVVDMGQIPVFPLELPPWKYWVSNSYMDDFSELHLKDMFARQEMGGIIPSAGVGTAFNREAIDHLADHNAGDPFLVGNLTEDYFLGIQLKRAGYRAGFINYPIDRIVVKKDAGGQVVSKKFVTDIVAVRENFPTKFWDAVRQRSRWILGISMQCWELAGWEGSAAVRYTLMRDRRAPLVHMINAIGYIVIFSWLVESAFRLMPFVATSYWRPLFTVDSLLWTLILIDTCFLVYRILIKVYYVKEIYGWKQGLFAIPRYPVGNFINFFATCRALSMYVKSRVFGKQLVWLKTAHVFPSATDLSEYAASIEDLILQEARVPRERIEQLIKSTDHESIPKRLLELRLLDEEHFTSIWSRFSGIPEKTIVSEDTDPALLEKMPEQEALDDYLIPVKAREDGHIEVAFLEPPSPRLRHKLETRFSRPLAECLITPTNLRILRERGYSTRAMPRFRAAASEAFEEIGPAKLREVRNIQFRTGRRFSDILVTMGHAGAGQCRAVWSKLFDAEPCAINTESLDREALQALGPVFCSLHRMAPLVGHKLIFQDILHPEIMSVIEERLGSRPRLVTDLASPVRHFLRNVFVSVKVDELILDRMLAVGSLSAADATELRSLKGLLSDPLPHLIRNFQMAGPEAVFRAFSDVSRLPTAQGALSEVMPAGVMSPGFEARTGSKILEAQDGRITFGLSSPIAGQDFSEICTRLMRCAVRFVLIPPQS